MHLKLSLFLSLLACLASDKIKLAGSLNLFWRIALVQVVLMTGLLADEGHQYLAASRRFEWMDFSYGAIGLFIGLIIYLLIVVITRFFNGSRRKFK